MDGTVAEGKAHRRRMKRLYAAIGVGIIAVGLGLLIVFDTDTPFLAVGGAILGQVLIVGRTSTCTAYEHALVFESTGGPSFVVPWSHCIGYSIDKDRISIHRRLPGRTIHCSLAYIEDRDTIMETLDAHLGRLEK